METPQEAEVKGDGTAKFTWRGREFVVSTEYGKWSVDFLESLEENKAVGIVRGALGPNQWRTVKAMNLQVDDLSELADDIAAAMGFGRVGESEASSA